MAIAESQRGIWHRQMDRRQLLSKGLIALGSAMGAADAVVIASLVSQQSRKEPVFPEVTSQYGLIVERKYGIRLSEEPDAPWSIPGVLMVGETLEHLPSHIYGAHNGKALEFISTLHPRTGATSNDFQACYAFIPEHPEVGDVRIMPSAFKLENKIYVPDEIIHEGAHRVNLSGEGFVQHSLLNIINEDFNSFSADINQKMDVTIKADLSTQHVISRLKYGLTLPGELVAVLSELYAWGEGVFSTLSKWIEPDKVSAFYEIIGIEVFRGRTYKSHKEITDGLVFDKKGNPVKIGFLGIDKTKKPAK